MDKTKSDLLEKIFMEVMNDDSVFETLTERLMQKADEEMLKRIAVDVDIEMKMIENSIPTGKKVIDKLKETINERQQQLELITKAMEHMETLLELCKKHKGGKDSIQEIKKEKLAMIKLCAENDLLSEFVQVEKCNGKCKECSECK